MRTPADDAVSAKNEPTGFDGVTSVTIACSVPDLEEPPDTFVECDSCAEQITGQFMSKDGTRICMPCCTEVGRFQEKRVWERFVQRREAMALQVT